MLQKLILIGCCAYLVAAMIQLEDGFIVQEIKFPECLNQPKTSVLASLADKHPELNVKVFSHDFPERTLEEFFFGQIKVVVNDDDIVVEVPIFIGQAPNLKFTESLLNEKWDVMYDAVFKKFPNTKIVVEQGKTILRVNEGSKRDFIQILVDEDGKVSQTPTYKRVKGSKK